MIQKKLKIRGYSLNMDGLEEIFSFVDRFQDAQDEAIDLLLDQLDHESLVKSSIIDKEAVHRVISLLLEAKAAEEECLTSSTSFSHSSILVVDAFLVPKFQYDPIKKHFFSHAGSLLIHGDASTKSALYRDRCSIRGVSTVAPLLFLFHLGCSPAHQSPFVVAVFCSNTRASNSSFSDVAKFYATIMDNSKAYDNLEKSLDQLELQLTTPLALELLQRLFLEDKLAFKFFTWAARKHNYAHQPQAYNQMIDILSNTKYKIKQFRIVCDMLDHMKRSNRNAVPTEVLLLILRQYTEKHLTHLQKFAKKKRIRVKTQSEINAFNLLLKSIFSLQSILCMLKRQEGIHYLSYAL
ncbi:Pentatricopeptide repeat-containing-like protein [Theobroma cacao]|uniref:Pentatricopeptide repeat-containing-like protein n=1 Tax=Theobroma cacao TaxID=3641 RepID=A0A061FPT7_THECC|nr:Pentatricopeptide repeat-containing-like protein [Theobroma cacao]